MSTPSPLLTKFDFNKYVWQPFTAANGSDARVRVLGGGEYTQDIWNRYHKGDQTLFFAVSVDLNSPVPEDVLSEAARDVWLWLRYQIPTIAASERVNDKGVSTFVYESGSPSEIDQWAGRTFIVSKQQGGNVDLDELRRQLGAQKVPSDAGDQTWLHLVPGSAGTAASTGAVSKFGLLLHTHHTPFDGVALKIVLTRYLKQLAKRLSSEGRSGEVFEWGKEVNNLVPSSFRVLSSIEPTPIPPDSSEEPTFAHPYYASMGAVMQAIGDSMQVRARDLALVVSDN